MEKKLFTTAQETHLIPIELEIVAPHHQFESDDLEVCEPQDEEMEYYFDGDDGPDDDELEIKEISDNDGDDLEVFISELPGAPNGTKVPVSEVEHDDKEGSADENDAKTKKTDKWNWKGKGDFVAWLKERLASVPKHSGTDVAGLERALSYMGKIDDAISKAMREDLDGELDADKVEEVRSQIEDGMERLEDRIETIKKTKKKKKTAEINPEMVKEGGSSLGMRGVYITVPVFISSLARIIINAHVSNGRDMNDIYNRLVKKFAVNDREELEIQQVLLDMGMPLHMDRGLAGQKEVDINSSDNFDFSAYFHG